MPFFDDRSEKRSACFLTPAPLPGAQRVLVCLPPAGAGASNYHSWGKAFREHGVEIKSIQYPGRETRLAEPCITDLRDLVRHLADEWESLVGSAHCAVFGHSMGALLAYELTVELNRRAQKKMPTRLFLSGRNPPHVPNRIPPLSSLPDDELFSYVAHYLGRIPPEISIHSEMRSLVISILRADFALLDTYQYKHTIPFIVPISVFGATEDPWTREVELREWARYTTSDCSLRLFQGDHFYYENARSTLFSAIVDRLMADIK